nr:RNA polymerase sigma-70 factor [uncultured Prevotella sp.]
MKSLKEESYQALFRRYYPRMFYYAKRIVGEEAADDVVQEVFLELWNRMESLDTDEPPIESYLYKTTYSRALNYLKRYRKVDTSVIEDINELRMACFLSPMGNGEKDMENEDLRKRINQAIGELPDKCREIFVLSYLKDMKNSEIAQMLNVSVRTVEAHIYKALKNLRTRLGVLFLLFLHFFSH